MAKKQYTKRSKESSLSVNVTSLKVDVKGLKLLQRKLKSLPKVDFGYLNGDMHPVWGITYAGLAVINEFGIHGTGANEWFIPPRPFMRQTLTANKFFVKELEAGLRSALLDTKSSVTIRHFRPLGKRMADRLNLMVRGGFFTGNAPFTIEKKGRDDPLNWTGFLGKAAKYRIVR